MGRLIIALSLLCALAFGTDDNSQQVEFTFPDEVSMILAEAFLEASEEDPRFEVLSTVGPNALPQSGEELLSARCYVTVSRPRHGVSAFKTPGNRIRCGVTQKQGEGFVSLELGEQPIKSWGNRFGTPVNSFAIQDRSPVVEVKNLPLTARLFFALAKVSARHDDLSYFKRMGIGFATGDQLLSVDILHPTNGLSMVSCDQWEQVDGSTGIPQTSLLYYCSIVER